MGDASNLLRHSYQLVQQATAHDRTGNYQEALRLYLTSLEGFVSALKIEKNEKVRATLKQKMNEYMDRAETLKEIIEKRKGGIHSEPCCVNSNSDLVLPSVPTTSLSLPSVPNTLPGGVDYVVQPTAPIIETPYVPNVQQHHQQPKRGSAGGGAGQLVQSRRIEFGQTGCSYDSLFGQYLASATIYMIEDPYIRARHQIDNLIRLCELIVKRSNSQNSGRPIQVKLVTTSESTTQEDEVKLNFIMVSRVVIVNTKSMMKYNVSFDFEFITTSTIKDTSVITTNRGLTIKISRGLDMYYKPDSLVSIGGYNDDLRPIKHTINGYVKQ
ncbi:microtubule interacting and transport domain-containing protein [Heterostelium album PN500]|uniref:Microtubule interacting and transport domain-containing protein n=1 Tax=Heterostelium pallidum (strain ATCC 26659 / Pp 5 / PN500) TaxID=670386 RepID=D3AXG0_HETP5|nr:microtubule interacting and transport domain-containing protein [Heterostelium album PN500]EFA86229.1 microtubule interacting and transport domain-containing protein [Heterostelium album PN500]|eukprot:XP_020438334.1 microtubule interacting and transport domain-containing protein [Heterostelium album PN500]